MKKLSTLLIAVLVAAGLLRMCVYTVNEREYALVFALGELKTVISEPGLHVKLPPPLQNIVYLDKRILNLDAAGADLVQTSEKKNLLIDTFVKWRIEDPRLYWVSFQGSEPAAANRVSALLRDVLNVVVNKRTVNQITSSERDKAMVEISQLLQERVRDVGIGIVDVRRIFGIGAIKMTEKVELVINLEPWEDGKQYDRLGMDSQTTSILDIAVPSLTIPVKPGRNLAVIIEVAAMNDRQKKMGFNAAKELQERMLKQYGN